MPCDTHNEFQAFCSYGGKKVKLQKSAHTSIAIID